MAAAAVVLNVLAQEQDRTQEDLANDGLNHRNDNGGQHHNNGQTWQKQIHAAGIIKRFVRLR